MIVTDVRKIKAGTSKTGKGWILYGITVEDGREATGFNLVKVGQDVDLIPDDQGRLNYEVVKRFEAEGGNLLCHRQDKEPLMSKDDYWQRKDQRDAEAIPRIARCHAQEMAIRLAETFPHMVGVSDDKDRCDLKKLRWFINWFQKDATNPPIAKPFPAPLPPEPSEDEQEIPL